jgi:hypothetical protein
VPASGLTLLRAAVAGYEVAARLAVGADPAVQYRRGFHPTGTCGAFGCAAASAVVFGLDADGVTAALGVAGSQAAGSMEFLEDGAWTKRFHPGWAANAGLHAAALARAGFRAPADDRRRAVRLPARVRGRRHPCPYATTTSSSCAPASSRMRAAATRRARSTRPWHSAPATRSTHGA